MRCQATSRRQNRTSRKARVPAQRLRGASCVPALAQPVKPWYENGTSQKYRNADCVPEVNSGGQVLTEMVDNVARPRG